MIENVETTNQVAQHAPMLKIATEKYALLATIIFLGAVSHAIEDARKSGWKGLGWFCANIFVAGFVGVSFSEVVSHISSEWVYAAGGVGGYMGPAAFKYVQEITISRLGVTVKK